MSADVYYLGWTALLTALLWIPYILNRFAVRGLADTVGYPEQPAPQAPWAERAQHAHANAVENLVVFAALVLAAHAVGASSGVTAAASLVYFWARVAHYVVYALALPWLRTLAFAVGWVCQLAVAWELLT